MARLAAFHLHRLMLEHKRAPLVRVAREANCILRRGSTHLLRGYRSVRIVAVAALDQTFVHAVMKGHLELRLLLKMARIAKLGLGFYQQEFLGLGVVWRMAGDATHIASCMCGIDCIHVLRATSMASHAAGIDFF